MVGRESTHYNTLHSHPLHSHCNILGDRQSLAMSPLPLSAFLALVSVCVCIISSAGRCIIILISYFSAHFLCHFYGTVVCIPFTPLHKHSFAQRPTPQSPPQHLHGARSSVGKDKRIIFAFYYTIDTCVSPSIIYRVTITFRFLS